MDVMKDNTIVCFWSDHGWHLGEKEHWRKFALWEEATRSPLIFLVPGVTKSGARCDRTVDFIRAVSILTRFDVPGTTVTRYCASSLQTSRMAFHAIKAGEGEAFLSVGVECVSRYVNGLGWGNYANDHEDANGQFEQNFTYADALISCDRAIFFRYMVHTLAQRQGLLATFMPKPFTHLTGNGCHFHL